MISSRSIKFIFIYKRLILPFILTIALIIFRPSIAQARLQVSEAEDGIEYLRSLESLRDLDSQTWQLVVYSEDLSTQTFVLRIVGFPGSLRIDHPTSLEVHSGIRDWELEDITLKNMLLVNDPREAAVEFDVSPIVLNLTNNRPLRFKLKGVFTELPIPPYLVGEWRSLMNKNSFNEKI